MESLNRLKEAHEKEVLGEWLVEGSTVLIGRWSGRGRVVCEGWGASKDPLCTQ